MKKFLNTITKKQLQIGICFIIYIFICIAIYNFNQQPRMSIKILYEFGLEDGTHGKLSVVDNGNISKEVEACVDKEARKKYEMQFSLDAGVIPESMIIDLQYGVQQTRVKAIEIYNRVIQVRRFSPAEIPVYFECQDGENYYFESPFIVYETDDDSPTIIGNEQLYEELKKIFSQDERVKMNLLLWCTILFILAIVCINKQQLIFLYIRQAKEWIHKYYVYILIALLLIALFMVAKVAIQSDNYAHPDENVTRQAIDYYLGGWFKPLISSNWIAGTFSEYGVSRLEEISWYYLVAGKIGWLVAQTMHLFSYYRFLNLLLFILLVIMAIRNHKEESWILAVMLFTPQLWYLFSYATTDGWDTFWSIMVVYELCKKNSLLNRYLENKSQHNILPAFALGMLFSLIFEGKTNYYLILLVAFMDLLVRLFGKEKRQIWMLIKKYVFILLTTYMMFVVKQKLDDVAFFIPQEIQTVDMENYNFDLDSPEAMGENNDLYEQGMSVPEFIQTLKEWKFFTVLFESFCGFYGWMAYKGTNGYYCYMLILYIILHGCIIYNAIRYQSKRELILTFALLGLYFVNIGAIIYNCYFNDLQIQGRYLMPMVAIVGYLLSKNKKLYSNKLYQIAMILLALGGIYSYATVCIKFVM